MNKMTEIEKQLAYHRHELNRFRLMGFHHSIGDVHREAIKRLTKIQKCGPVLSDEQAKHVASWMKQRREALEAIIMATTNDGVSPSLVTHYTEWLIKSVEDCQCDIRDTDWEVLLDFLKAEGAAFAMTLPDTSGMTVILNNIRSAIACPA